MMESVSKIMSTIQVMLDNPRLNQAGGGSLTFMDYVMAAL